MDGLWCAIQFQSFWYTDYNSSSYQCIQQSYLPCFIKKETEVREFHIHFQFPTANIQEQNWNFTESTFDTRALYHTPMPTLKSIPSRLLRIICKALSREILIALWWTLEIGIFSVTTVDSNAQSCLGSATVTNSESRHHRGGTMTWTSTGRTISSTLLHSQPRQRISAATKRILISSIGHWLLCFFHSLCCSRPYAISLTSVISCLFCRKVLYSWQFWIKHRVNMLPDIKVYREYFPLQSSVIIVCLQSILSSKPGVNWLPFTSHRRNTKHTYIG